MQTLPEEERKEKLKYVVESVILPLVQIDGGVHRVAMSVSKPRVGESLSEKEVRRVRGVRRA